MGPITVRYLTQPASTQRWSATGVIKKVFPSKPDPYGFLRLLTPLEFRGKEATFFYRDLLLPVDEHQFVQPGLTMQFSMIKKPQDHMMSPVPFKAEQMKPMDPVEQQGGVVRGPREGGQGIIVALDYTSMNVHISPNSWTELCASNPVQEQLLPGDTVVVRLYWNEVLKATKEKRSPVGEIVTRLPTLPRMPLRRRSCGTRRRTSLSDSSEPAEATRLASSAETGVPEREQGKEIGTADALKAQEAEVTAKEADPTEQIPDNAAPILNKEDIQAKDHVDGQEVHCVEREGRKRVVDRLGDAPGERRRTRSCSSGLTHASLLNQAFFSEEMVRHMSDVDGGHACSRRVSSPLFEPACVSQCNPYATGQFLSYDGSFNVPILTQAGMWSHWSQTAFRGPHSPYAGRMSLKDFLQSGGSLY
ncbi:hypothetical protein BIW11_14133 [Tropilaelaps mercedesae]|uniref:Uncharacterized protein n=1 Tax=Tropilaelaps mercedesae TaxID=418985 RepID=A0A1V9WZ70_9ACAR|nr:hypothetical protein BIW11_14133 [Tropilaelaps mercedesae]